MMDSEWVPQLARQALDRVDDSALDTQVGGNHYREYVIQPIEFITKNRLDFFQGNVIKYALRYRGKNGAEDIRKIIQYCELVLELEYGEKP
jgi:hypothetical protein